MTANTVVRGVCQNDLAGAALPGPVNVLMVDDTAENLVALETILAGPDYALTKASSAHEALVALLTADFALILLDVEMPGMNGYELAQLIKGRKKTQEIPIIFLTAHYPDEQHALAGYDAGAVDYLTKPLSPSILRSKVAVLTELYRKNLALNRAVHLLANEVSERTRIEDELKGKNVELDRALRERETLLKEIHHRVKNNLQIIVSLLRLQARFLKDEPSRAMFEESQNRVHSISLVHEKLYRSEDLTHVDINDYFLALTQGLTSSWIGSDGLITLDVEAAGVQLTLDKAIPCGLIVTELATNALKHAFPEGTTGSVYISAVWETEGWLKLTVRDDGVGLPEDLDLRRCGSLGLELVNTLIQQLGADLEIQRDHGTTFQIRFQPALE